MTEEELEDWKSMKYRMNEEGIDYCFEKYNESHGEYFETMPKNVHKIRLFFDNSKKYRGQIFVDTKKLEKEFKKLKILKGNAAYKLRVEEPFIQIYCHTEIDLITDKSRSLCIIIFFVLIIITKNKIKYSLSPYLNLLKITNYLNLLRFIILLIL